MPGPTQAKIPHMKGSHSVGGGVPLTGMYLYGGRRVVSMEGCVRGICGNRAENVCNFRVTREWEGLWADCR